LATYYIDYTASNDSFNGLTTSTPWKRCPGMAGFGGSYSHVAGDTFIFKGGVTWAAACLPLTIGYSGSAGNIDTYTTDHSWYTGGAWSQPTFDYNHNGTTTGIINATQKHHFTINDLYIINVGTALLGNNYKAGTFDTCYEVTISNCVCKTYTWMTFYFLFQSAGSYSNFYIFGNDFSSTTGAIWFAHAATNTNMHNLIMHDNAFHDFADMIGGGAHGDGALHYFSSSPTDSTQYLDGVEFYNNIFYGNFTRGISGGAEDMTAFIYSETALSGNIYNNIFSFYPYLNTASPYEIFYSLIALVRTNGRTTSLNIFNNTFYGNPSYASGGGVFVINGGYPNVVIKNNIIVYGRYGGICSPANPSGLVNDYNEWWTPDGFSGFGTYGSHNIPTGSPYNSDPLFIVDYSNLRLTASSPAIDKGVDLSGLGISGLSYDLDGKSRPMGAGWDMGAYEYDSGAITKITVLSATTVNRAHK
jgi:hypothetical protein